MRFFNTFAWIILCALVSACSQSNSAQGLQSKPIVQKLAVTHSDPKPGITSNSSVNVTLVVDKDVLLNQEFLYGADLQYSDYHDPGFDLDNQSMAIGHIPVRFRIAGDELELVADNRRLSASDVNHPELLISRYKILSQNDTTLTISGANSSVFLGEIFEGTKNAGTDSIFNPAGTLPRETWIRSFDFVPQGNYLLQQTSIVTADGNIAEFAESVFPRATLNPGPNFEKFVMDPSSPQGMNDDFFVRFRFLPGESIYDASAGMSASGDPKAVAYAAHFDISPKADGTPATIDWYVTSNAPDEALPALKEAVEGWNRYFKAEKGVGRDVVQFKGHLPQGIHLGDPRYNVINWDSKRVAGAAYETQAADPDSGKQSHSLIYMPAAWLQIGLDYYKSGIAADIQSKDPMNSRIGRSNKNPAVERFGCMRDLRDSVALIASGRLSRDDVKNYATELLKQTLFHEVGHALGLAHNFKGSLSYNVADRHSMFSNSIMDYNDYEIERAAFSGVDTSDGPLLEYDRQAISAIYNRHRDISNNDSKPPVCNDAEADNEAGGVDPLCIRYDIENDPTHSIVTALNRIESKKLDGDTSLSDALLRIPNLVLSDSDIQSAQSEDQLNRLADQLGNGLTGAMGFYFVSGKASLGKVVKTNIKALLEYEDGILPDGYKADQMRATAFDGVQKTVAFTKLPSVVQSALDEAKKAGLKRISQAPYFSGGDSQDSKNQELAALGASVDAAINGFTQGENATLASLRAGLLTALARHDQVSFFFGTVGRKRVDYEKDIIGILLNTVTAKSKVTHQEQVAAAKSLVTYAGRLNGDPAIDEATQAVTKARMLAKDAQARDDAEELLGILTKQ